MKLKLMKEKAEPGSATKSDQPMRKRDIAERWGGDPRILSAGFVAVPSLFLQRMAQFKPYSLTPAEALFVICVMAHKWDERDPFPSYKRIAGWMGKSESYARRLAKNLATKGMLRRQQRIGQSNSFDFKQLFTMILGPDSTQTAVPRKRSPDTKDASRPRSKRKRSA